MNGHRFILRGDSEAVQLCGYRVNKCERELNKQMTKEDRLVQKDGQRMSS